MSHERIGKAQKNPGTLSQEEGVSFEIPYGEDKYGITLSNEEMDLLFDKGHEELMGRQALIGSSCVIELGQDLPLFADVWSLDIKSEPNRFAKINMEVAIATQSHVYEHRGILLARRGIAGSWEFENYEIQPPLRDPEEIFGYAEQVTVIGAL